MVCDLGKGNATVEFKKIVTKSFYLIKILVVEAFRSLISINVIQVFFNVVLKEKLLSKQ